MNLRVNLVAAAVALGCAGFVASRVSSATAPDAGSAASPQQQAIFAATVGSGELGWRRTAEQAFPSDLWSQRDAFHSHEAQSIRELAGGYHVPFEEVIRAIDADVHRSRDVERSARAIPCKPRPFYD